MHYLIQAAHYMAVTGRKAWYIAVVILGKEFQFARIERDEAMIANLIAIEEAFWNSYVVPQIMPPPDGSKACALFWNAYCWRYSFSCHTGCAACFHLRTGGSITPKPHRNRAASG